MKVVFSDKARKKFLKLDKPVQRQIQKFVSNLEEMKNPKDKGKALVGNLSGFWRYRVGDYRVLCKIQDQELVIFVIEIGHRKDVYDV